MTIYEAYDKAVELGYNVEAGAYSKAYKLEDVFFNLYYDERRFGTLILKNHQHRIHSHYWKKQDDPISKVKVEEWEKGLRDYIILIKEKIIQKKVKELNKDF